MNTNFTAALAETLKFEGGWSNNPKDPGGATMHGVIQTVYDAYRHLHGLPHQSVRLISDAEVHDIYKNQYWDAVQGDQLPVGVDFCVFDYGVNSGPSRGVKALQHAVGVPIDGHLGLVTLHAAATADHKITINAICNARLAFLKGLRTWSTFGRGWSDRVNGVRAKALAMANVK